MDELWGTGSFLLQTRPPRHRLIPSATKSLSLISLVGQKNVEIGTGGSALPADVLLVQSLHAGSV